jgi:ABC-type multidrug transport system fused ATPase/permease subunit/CRP-like cAMP-binding protein
MGTGGRHAIEVREPGKSPRHVEITGDVEVGREGVALTVADGGVSRRHLRLRSDGAVLSVVDLGSTNGTTVNGSPIVNETVLRMGDTVRAGGVEIEVIADSRQPTEDETATVPPLPPPTPPAVVAAPRPPLDAFDTLATEAAVIRFRPGSTGAQAARGVAASAERARKALTGLGSEPWGTRPQICLVDPYPDPDRPGEVVASGTVVDTEHAEVWMVVTPESPPEPLERPLALVFGAALPAAADLGILLEGYGLHMSGAPDPDAELRAVSLPPLDQAEGEMRSLMALSFVRSLIERGGAAELMRLFGSAQPGRVDAAARELYGFAVAGLEEAWLQKLADGPPNMNTSQFIKLSGRYLRPYLGREAEMMVYALFALAFTVVFPFASRRLFDKAIPSGQFSQVVSILVVLGIAFVVSLLAGLRRAYLSAHVSSSVERHVRTEMFARLQELSTGWYHGRQEGEVLSRVFNDVGLLETGLSQALREGSFQLLSLVVSAVVLLILNPLLGVQEQTGSLYNVAAENYGAKAIVKALGLEAQERARFGRVSDRLFDRQVKLQLFGGLFGLSVNMILTALRLVVLGLGAWLIIHHHLTIGGLVAFLIVMGEVIGPVTALSKIGQQIQASSGALIRVNEVLEAVPQVAAEQGAEPLRPLSDEIRLANVTFSYTSERPTLQDIDVRIKAGTRAAFVGPTGAGKSSVLQLLMRFFDPDEGHVLFDGRDIRGATLDSLRGQLGVVFPDTFLFDATIRENIATGRAGATDAEVEEAAREAELHDFIMTLPRGYDTLVGERAGRLSGGQRQRIAIARALLRNPRVIILDEVTSALDPRTERLISDTLDRVAHGRTTVAVTHRLTSTVRYDRIFVLVEGRVVEQGTHEELLRKGGTYANLWGEQTGAAPVVDATFDARRALARVPLFAALSSDELDLVASRLRATSVSAGERLAEGGGSLTLIRRGRARLLSPGFAGELFGSAELGPGDAFGVSALLGQETGAQLEASTDLSLLVLDDDVIAGFAATLPSVAAALGGKGTAPAPVGGQRLSRVSMGPVLRASGVITVDQLRAEEARRLSARLPAVRP